MFCEWHVVGNKSDTELNDTEKMGTWDMRLLLIFILPSLPDNRTNASLFLSCASEIYENIQTNELYNIHPTREGWKARQYFRNEERGARLGQVCC